MKTYIKIFCLTCLIAMNEYCYGYSGVAEQDSLALVAFYWATDGPNWISNQDGFSITDLKDDIEEHYQGSPDAGMGKWLEGPVKDWYGVMVEEVDGVWRVTRLWPVIGRRENGQNNLKGYVPKEVGLLTALKWFRINGNDGFSWTELPDEVYHPTLERIDVEKCNFGGIVSDAFRKCTNVGYINLRYNYFDYIPVLDFLSPEFLLEEYTGIEAAIYLYSTRLSFAQIEPSIDYFYTISSVPGKIKVEARDLTDVGIEQEIIVTEGSDVTLACNDAGTQGTCTWYHNGLTYYITGNEYTIENVSAADTGEYRGRLVNDYIKSYDQNTNYGPVDTKPIYVRFQPVSPVCQSAKTSYSGNEISLTFSKPMADPTLSQASQFTVKRNGNDLNINKITRSGRLDNIFTLSLDSSFLTTDTILVSYSKGSIVDENGGVLGTFNDTIALNLTRKAPQLVKAVTRTDGEGIILTFDQFIDAKTLSPSDFLVNTDKKINVYAVYLDEGPLDDSISKSVLLVLEDPLSKDDTVTVEYKKGSLTALYGGALQSIAPAVAENVVQVDRTPVTLYFNDGTENMNNIIVKGNVKLIPISLTDDGTSGDATSGDHTWSKFLELTDGDYNWSVYERTIKLTYDTTKIIDPETGKITIEITPSEVISDSLLSEGYDLSLIVSDGVVSGDSVFSIADKTLIFKLDMSGYMEKYQPDTLEPYLMGLNNDWVTGIPMLPLETTSDSTDFVLTVESFSVNEKIFFNFRNGDYWENNSPEKRSYTVKESNDTIMAVFGVLDTATTIASHLINEEILVYPNPVIDVLTITNPNNTDGYVKIYNLYGIKVLEQDYTSTRPIVVSHLLPGVYVIEISSDNTSMRSIKSFIKK